MVGLQAYGEMAGQADRVSKAGHDMASGGDGDQVLQAHQLADGRGHLRRDAGTQRGQRLRFGGEQEFAELTHGQRSYRRKCDRVVGIDDQSGYLVCFICNDRFGEDGRQRHIGQRHLCGDALGGRVRCETGQRIA